MLIRSASFRRFASVPISVFDCRSLPAKSTMVSLLEVSRCSAFGGSCGIQICTHDECNGAFKRVQYWDVMSDVMVAPQMDFPLPHFPGLPI